MRSKTNKFVKTPGATNRYISFVGQKSLKVNLSLISSLEHPRRPKRRRSSNTSLSDTSLFSESGVKKMALLAVIPHADETYERVEDLVNKLELRLGDNKMLCADLKIVNIALGLQGHQCRHPCCFCEWIKGKDKHNYPLRTFEKLRKDHQEFLQHSGEKKDVKKFNNCIRPASSLFPEIGKVMDVVALPELHIMLGVVNKLFFELNAIDHVVATKWSRVHLHVQPAEWSSQYAGNDCKKLLANTEVLRNIARGLSARQQAKKKKIGRIADAFESFQKLVHSCFGSILYDTWERDLVHFHDSYRATGASISPKIHIVIAHLPDFVKNFGALGVYSEQAGEAVHQDFKREFQKYYVKDTDHPKYLENLLKAVCSYNENNKN